MRHILPRQTMERNHGKRNEHRCLSHRLRYAEAKAHALISRRAAKTLRIKTFYLCVLAALRELALEMEKTPHIHAGLQSRVMFQMTQTN